MKMTSLDYLVHSFPVFLRWVDEAQELRRTQTNLTAGIVFFGVMLVAYACLETQYVALFAGLMGLVLGLVGASLFLALPPRVYAKIFPNPRMKKIRTRPAVLAPDFHGKAYYPETGARVYEISACIDPITTLPYIEGKCGDVRVRSVRLCDIRADKHVQCTETSVGFVVGMYNQPSVLCTDERDAKALIGCFQEMQNIMSKER